MQQNKETVVSLVGVTKRFGEAAPVLEMLDLRLDRGGFTALIGPSGCGKTTLLRLIAGLEAATSGEVIVPGSHPGVEDSGIAYVFQDPTLLPWLDAADNAALLLRLRGLPRKECRERALEALRLVKIHGLASRVPAELSGGQRMRVSLARALAVSPRLLLLDEPFGALDEMARETLNEELLSIRQLQGWTALFVTHSVAEAVFLSDRVLVMDAHPGRIRTSVPVPLPYPRTLDTRISPAYLGLVADVTRSLRGHGEGAP